jgi:hypothetical protein
MHVLKEELLLGGHAYAEELVRCLRVSHSARQASLPSIPEGHAAVSGQLESGSDDDIAWLLRRQTSRRF